MNNMEITLLTNDEIGIYHGLDAIKKYEKTAAGTDLTILTSGFNGDSDFRAIDDQGRKGRTSRYFLNTADTDFDGSTRVAFVQIAGFTDSVSPQSRKMSIRPVLNIKDNFATITQNRRHTYGINDLYEIDFGEYPQYAAPKDLQEELEEKYKNKLLQKTGRDYTFDNVPPDSEYQREPFAPRKCEEYAYQGKKYIRVSSSSLNSESIYYLSNWGTYTNYDYVWIEVSPVTWLIDDKTKKLISKRCLLAGIRFDGFPDYTCEFEETDMYWYLNRYMLKELFQEVKIELNQTTPSYEIDTSQIDNLEKELSKSNDLSEEEISALQDAIEQEKSSNKKGR